jgi:hypothetical protein
MYGQIRIELLRSLSQDHLALFADPNPDPITGDIQWFAPFPGEVIKLADCSEDDRAGYEFHLARLVDDITNHIDKLNQSDAENSRSMANVLTMALEIPDESHIFVVGGRPVIAGWGHVPRGPAVLRKPLIALVRRVLTIAPAVVPEAVLEPSLTPAAAAAAPKVTEEQPGPVTEPEQPAPPVPADGARVHALVPIVNEVVGPIRFGMLNWFLWPILGLLLVSIGYLLLRYCGLGWPLSSFADSGLIVNYCVASSEPLRNNDLSAHLADLQQSLAEKQRRLCATAPTPSAPPQRDTSTEDRLRRENGRIGAVNVILTWNTLDDLDLHVTCPGGEEIYYKDKNNCGGVLDVDMNSTSGAKSANPVENVTWPAGAAPAGTYKVEVTPYRRESSQPTEFKVELRINGELMEEYNRRFDSPAKMSVFEFGLPYSGRRQQ